MPIPTIFIISFFAFSLSAQKTDFDCSKILNQTPYFTRHNISEPNDSTQIDIEILKTCGQLDSIDCELLKGPILGTTLVKLASNGNKVTYKAILDDFKEFKKSNEYAKFREVTIISKTLENKIASLAQFEKDKDLFIKLQMTESEMEKFKMFLQVNASEKMTYKEAFAKYLNSKPSYQSPEGKIIEFAELVSLDNALRIGQENNKPILIYFTCYACVNARKMEDRILTDDYIKTLITQKFVYFAAYLDDKRIDETTKSTVGKKYIELQKEKFNSDQQPQFYILNQNGKILSEIRYTLKTEEFVEFLNRGLK